MKIFFKLFPELKQYCANETEDIEERIEEVTYFAPYISLGVKKQMLFEDLLKYKDEKGSFPNNGSDFYKAELKQSLCSAYQINQDQNNFIV